jgi:hypothetical protein
MTGCIDLPINDLDICGLGAFALGLNELVTISMIKKVV